MKNKTKQTGPLTDKFRIQYNFYILTKWILVTCKQTWSTEYFSFNITYGFEVIITVSK